MCISTPVQISHPPQAGSHPNIVSMVGLTTDGGPTCLLLEFIPNGTLDDFLVALMEGPIPEWYTKFVRSTLRGAYHKHVSGDIMSIILQVADGMVMICVILFLLFSSCCFLFVFCFWCHRVCVFGDY